MFFFFFRSWYEYSKDNLLWKHLLRKDFNMTTGHSEKVTAAETEVDWKSEYVRLTDTVPNTKVQTLAGHTDEVLHVTFSHDGKDIVSCSKVIKWEHIRTIPI